MLNQKVWVGRSPKGKIEVVDFNPVETEAERARYRELGWEWVPSIADDGMVWGVPQDWIKTKRTSFNR